ncbi:hypothetical protein JCM14720_07270 [Calditerricola yamamurae]
MKRKVADTPGPIAMTGGRGISVERGENGKLGDEGGDTSWQKRSKKSAFG